MLDFNSLVELARSQGKSWQELLPQFRQWGVSALAFAELRLDELENYGICSVYSGTALGADTGEGCGEPGRPDAQSTYLVLWNTHPLMPSESLLLACQEAWGADKVRLFKSSSSRLARAHAIIEIGIPLRNLAALGVCFPQWGIEHAREAGLDIWLRPENKGPVTQASVRTYWKRLHQRYTCEGVIFGGASNEAVGYSEPPQLDETAACLKEYGWKLGLIELTKATQQKGIETLVRQLPAQTVRVFTVPPAQQATLRPERVSQMYSLAARERNLTLLYMRPYAYDPTPDKGFEQANELLFSSVSEGLRAKNMLGKAATFDVEVVPDRLSLGLLSMAGLAACWLTLQTFVRVPTVWAVASLLGFVILNAALARVHLWLALMALGTSCAACLLATVSQFSRLRAASQKDHFVPLMLQSTLAWLSMFLLAVAGAWVASCFLQETTYKLGLDIFRGVKIVTVLMPVGIALAWVLSGPERAHWLQIGAAPIKLYQLVGLGILAVGGVVYTMRTGNMAGTDVGESMEKERYLRMILDQLLGVRPRFKEFLLAHPAMLTVPILLRWGWREAAAVAVLVGATGICGQLDTFAHVHTPLYVSLIRCFLGAALGCGLGWLGAGLLWTLTKVARWVQKKVQLPT